MAVTDLANTEIALLRCPASRCHGNAATRGLTSPRCGVFFDSALSLLPIGSNCYCGHRLCFSPSLTSQLRHPIWGQDMALKAERHIVARLFAKPTTKLGLATTIAALWMTALPIASAVAQGAPGQISAARAAALQG